MAARYGLAPAEIWALSADEWAVLAVGLDRQLAAERLASAKLSGGR